jgi:ABC-type glutathione transport system ATPase component
VLLSGHQLELVEDECDAVAIIDHGRIVAAGEVKSFSSTTPTRRAGVAWAGAPRGGVGGPRSPPGRQPRQTDSLEDLILG